MLLGASLGGPLFTQPLRAPIATAVFTRAIVARTFRACFARLVVPRAFRACFARLVVPRTSWALCERGTRAFRFRFRRQGRGLDATRGGCILGRIGTGSQMIAQPHPDPPPA